MTTRPPVATKITALRAIADHLAKRAPAGDGHDAWKRVFGEVSSLASAAEALHNLHVTRDLTITDGAHVKRVAAAAQKFDRSVTDGLNRIFRIQGDGVADIERRRAAKTNLKLDVYASEIRDQWRRMNQTERTALLTELLEDPSRASDFAAIVSPGVPLHRV